LLTSHPDTDYYLKYKQEVGSSNVLGDEDTTQRVCKLFRKVELKEAGKRTSKKTILAAKRTTLKELASKLRDIGQELTKRVRAERLVDTISGLLPTVLAAGEGQQQHLCSSPSCAGTANSDQLFLICQCGHTACSTCLEQRVDFEACVHTGCGLPIDPTSLVKVLELGSTKDDGEEMSFGRKLDELASVIGKLPKNDQAIIFVPNSEVVSVIEGLLRFHQIPFHSLGKTNSSDTLEDFKTSKKKKVLVLNLQSESAAGANLVNANHVMFISPLLTESQYVYESAMAQAVARCRRYKQKKRVHIYHFAALQTIDVDILEQRHRRVDAIYSPGSTPPEETPELKEKKESTRLVRMKDESLALVPVSWLDDEDFVEGVEVDESFGSLIKVPY
jgi:SNF2 family DNA or RNA helicase